MYVLIKMYLIIDLVDQSIRSRYVRNFFLCFQNVFFYLFFFKCSIESIHV